MAVIKDLLSAMIEKINSSVRTVNGIAADEKGNVEVVGGASSWNDLPDKPFYDSRKIEYLASWDVSTDGKEAVDLPDGSAVYRVSDVILTAEEVTSANFILSNGAMETVDVSDRGSGCFFVNGMQSFGVYIPENNVTVQGLTFPTAGFYVDLNSYNPPVGLGSVTGELVPLPNKFIALETAEVFHISPYETVSEDIFDALYNAIEVERKAVLVRLDGYSRLFMPYVDSNSETIYFTGTPYNGNSGLLEILQLALTRGGRVTHSTNELYSGSALYLYSTSKSGKVFKVTVDDTGTLKATEAGEI